MLMNFSTFKYLKICLEFFRSAESLKLLESTEDIVDFTGSLSLLFDHGTRKNLWIFEKRGCLFN